MPDGSQGVPIAWKEVACTCMDDGRAFEALEVGAPVHCQPAAVADLVAASVPPQRMQPFGTQRCCAAAPRAPVGEQAPGQFIAPPPWRQRVCQHGGQHFGRRLGRQRVEGAVLTPPREGTLSPGESGGAWPIRKEAATAAVRTPYTLHTCTSATPRRAAPIGRGRGQQRHRGLEEQQHRHAPQPGLARGA